MRINIGPISGDKGAILDVEFQEALDLAEEGVALDGPVKVTATVTNAGPCFVVRGQVSAVVRLECSRCLSPFFAAVGEPMLEVFCGHMPDEDEHFPEGLGLDESDLADILPLEGERIDLTEAVLDTVLLSLPMRAVCGETCQGLCAQCGKNLNEGDCGCAKEVLDPRLAVLEQLLQQDDHEN